MLSWIINSIHPRVKPPPCHHKNTHPQSHPHLTVPIPSIPLYQHTLSRNNTPRPQFPHPYDPIRITALTPHPLKLLNNQEIRIQKAIHAVPRARLLALIQLAALDAAGHTLGPADVCEVVDGCSSISFCSFNLLSGRSRCSEGNPWGWRGGGLGKVVEGSWGTMGSGLTKTMGDEGWR